MGGQIFFEERANFRIRTNDLRVITKIVRKDQEKYENESHFFRAAVLKLMREERARLKL